jgi:hypothetical protein
MSSGICNEEDFAMRDVTEQATQAARSVNSPAPAVASVPSDKRAHVPRVAVIGVHGVAHHEPCATANAMAELLLSLPAKDHDDARYYDSFRSVGIQVPLQRLQVRRIEKHQHQTLFAKMIGFLQEKSADLADLGTQRAQAGEKVTRGSAGRAFMQLLLQDYKGGAHGDAYVTTRLEGNRAPEAAGGAAEVHIYEVLWADLARPTNTLLSFFLSLFQLLFHLGSLSRLAIDTGAAENTDLKWKAFRRVQRYAVRMLQLPLPLLKLILLIALFSCIPALSQYTHDRIWFPLVMGGIAGLAIAFLFRHLTGQFTMSPGVWVLYAIGPAALGLAAVAVAFRWIPRDALSAFECWLILGLALLFYVLDKYKNVRKGANYVGGTIFGIFFLTFLLYLILPGVKQSFVPQATVWTAEWMVATLRLSWMFLFGFVFLALVLGSVAWRSIPKNQPGRRARARAAVRTSRFALALPSLMFLLVTTLLWAGMFSIARGIQQPFFETRVLSLKENPWLTRLAKYHLIPNPETTKVTTNEICKSENPSCLETNLARIEPLSESAYVEPAPKADSRCQLSRVVPVTDNNPKNARPDYLEDILVWSAGTGFVVTLGLFVLALFLLFWWALPSVFAEKFRLRHEEKAPRFTTNAMSVRFGIWLSRGLDATSVVTFLFWCAIFLIPPMFLAGGEDWIRTGAKALRLVPDRVPPGAYITRWIVQSFAVGGTAAALAILVKYGSPGLGAILDVDTYLQTLPENATPRAKIVERYVSVLRYIARYRDADGRGYDSVVIVAHSLGSLISADLLRFLKAAGDPELAALGLAGENVANQGGISMKLLTMGSPIRQLLNRFFPYLYDWVRDQPDNGLHPLPDPTQTPPPPTIGESALPDPGELGLQEWVNVYRSGDYVGRSLWLDEWYHRTDGTGGSGQYPQAIYWADSGPRREACIGAGAHTRYWDDTAPDVADILNELIT